MWKKIKKNLLKTKTLIIVLVILAIIGWALVIYLGVKPDSQKSIYCTQCVDKLEKVNSYASLLEQSRKLVKQGKGLESLEIDIHALNNGSLLAEWENVVFGEGQDIEDYFDVVIDSIKFFSK
ncbi:hypothetical protein KKA23_02470 [Patescibacteria group bacterium]|nr:hypothetical protein [Patescibacteria group bacterium]MBU3922690.1 hypothetical protein [Patescibacteria group bacterium]